MLSFTFIVLGIVLYMLLLLTLKRRGVLSQRVSLWGPMVQLHSQAGLAFIDRLSTYRRVWRVWGTAGYILSLAGVVISFLLIIFAAFRALTSPEEQVISEPRNLLVIPGVNDFLPLAAAGELVIGLLLALIVHEGGHAIMCRISDMDIESTGLIFLGPIPFGAFVQPDEDSVERAPIVNRLRMYAGGVMNNVALSLIVLVLLIGPVTAFIVPAPGAGVNALLPEGPAEQAGITPGDRIVSVNGNAVASPRELDDYLSTSMEPALEFELADGRVLQVDRSVVVTATPQSLTALSTGDRLTQVEGQPVSTTVGFVEAVRTAGTGIVEVRTERGRTVDLAAGALVVPQPDQPLATAGAPVGDAVTITAIESSRIVTRDDLTAALATYESGETVSVTTVQDGELTTYSVTLGGETTAVLGVSTLAGVAGIQTTDVGLSTFPAEQFLTVLKESGDNSIGFFERLLVILFLPFASLAGIETNFPGFTPFIQNFYEVRGVPASIDSAWFFIASAMYWTIWVNINLAIFNCLPTVLLDGGHIFRDTVKLGLGKVGFPPDSEAVSAVIFGVLAVTGLSILLVMFGPFLLL